MGTNTMGWIDILSTNDNDQLLDRIYRVISKHSAVRALYSTRGISGEGLRDLCRDLTQELYLKLHQKDRWRSYLDNNYTDQQVEQELYRIEVPNLVSQLQRDRYPESYRIARRVSDLIQTRSEFQHYSRPVQDVDGVAQKRSCNKMALKVYGLSTWPLEKAVRSTAALSELTKDVAVRPRDTRRMGRGSGSQVIISNEDLKCLVLEIFHAIDTPTDIRTIRSLVLSKIGVQDCRPVYIDAVAPTTDPQPSAGIDLRDNRPSPLEILLEKETSTRVDLLADEFIEKLRKTVRNKPRRFLKLVGVAWHCYFDRSSPSQSSTAQMMGISDSLVSHYRRIFDAAILGLGLNRDELILLNGALEKRLAGLMPDLRDSLDNLRLTGMAHSNRNCSMVYADSADSSTNVSAPV